MASTPAIEPASKPPGTEMFFHQAAHRLPFGGADAALQAPVRDDFDISVRELHVDQHAVVVFRVPNAQMGEDVERPGARAAAR